MLTIQEVLKASDGELLDIAATLPGAIRHTDKYVYVDRGHPICLVAHVDTVRHKDKLELIEHNGVIRNKHGVLGADDRAGVFALFQLADTGCNLLFTNYEESGGKGACLAASELALKGVNLLVELDRKGCNEYVFYSYSLPKQVEKYIESFGYIQNYGSYSDIAEFYRVPGVNLSIGYYNQHTSKESLHLDEMWLNIERCRRIIESPIEKRYKPKVERFRDEYSWDIPDLKLIKGAGCKCCGAEVDTYDTTCPWCHTPIKNY